MHATIVVACTPPTCLFQLNALVCSHGVAVRVQQQQLLLLALNLRDGGPSALAYAREHCSRDGSLPSKRLVSVFPQTVDSNKRGSQAPGPATSWACPLFLSCHSLVRLPFSPMCMAWHGMSNSRRRKGSKRGNIYIVGSRARALDIYIQATT